MTSARVPASRRWLRPDAGWSRSELETHLRDEYSTFTRLLEPMLERAGFGILEAECSDSKIFASYVCERV